MQSAPPPGQNWPATLAWLLLVFVFFFSIPFLPGILTGNSHYGLAADRKAPEFELLDQNNSSISLNTYLGDYVFLMFGYLNCDSVCHSQATLFQEIELLADMGNTVHFVYISMDPGRDSPEQLAAYFDARGGNFTSLRANNLKTVQRVAKEYRAFFAPDKNIKKGDYMINHPGLFYLIGPDGNLRFTYTANQITTHRIVEELTVLRQTYENIN